jgi:hypothetical protein
MLLTGLPEWQWLGPLIAHLAVGLLFFFSGRGNDRRHRYVRHQNYQSATNTRLALGIFIPSRSSLPGGSFLAFCLGSRVAQHRSFGLIQIGAKRKASSAIVCAMCPNLALA